MLASGSFDEHLIHTLSIRLQHIEKEEADLKERLDKCIHACWETLLLLRQQILAYPFPDQAAEIHFFKKVKPAVLSRHIYYQLVHRLHLDLREGSAQLQSEKLRERLQEIDRYFEENRNYYHYYRNDDTHHDELYFVRGKYDWKRCPHACDIGDDFSTSFDAKLAELMAHEQLAGYVEGLLDPAYEKDINCQLVSEGALQLLSDESQTNIVELGYALHAKGAFGKVTIKEVMGFLSKSWGVDLGKFYDIFIQIRERKNATKFLDELKSSLLSYIEKSQK